MDRQQIFGAVADLARGVEPRLAERAIGLDDTPLTAYGLTSLTLLQLVERVEARFGITISDGEAFAAGSMRALVELIERKVHAPARPA